jgi:hypothetical protein
MPLAFLTPWIWLGAIAVTVPLYLHLRRKREPNLVRFSAVRFLRDQSKAQHTPRALRDWLLLLVRCLGLVLVVGAFSWPYWRTGITSHAKESVVYILDNTLSRQANGGFLKDRDRTASDLQQLRPGKQAAVIELTSTPRVVVAFGEDPLVARGKVLALSPSCQHGSFLAAFRLANSLFAHAPSQHRRIVLLSDNQAGQWDENVSTPPFLNNVQLDLPNTLAREWPNLWVSDPRAQRVYFGDHSRVNFTVRLGHLGPASTAKVTVRANGTPILERDVDLQNQPRTILIQAQCDADPSKWLSFEAQVQGTPDALEIDNRAFYAVPPIIEGKVALLAQSPYLRVALSPEVMRGHWQTSLLDPEHLSLEPSSKSPADVLCVESAFLQKPEARNLVKQYLAAGRGVFLVVNHLSPVIDSCLEELGFEPDGTLDLSQTTPDKSQLVFADHSIFQPFQSPDFAKLDDLVILRCARLKAREGRPLMLAPSGMGLFFESTRFPGKLLVCAFGFERDQTSWPIHPTFVPLLDLTLQAARAQDAEPTLFVPGATALIQFPERDLAADLVVRDHDKEIETVSIDHGRARVRVPGVPGIYNLRQRNRPETLGMLAVNAPAVESELVFVPAPKQLAAWSLPKTARANERAPAGSFAVGFSGILQQHLWWWMILGGLLVLALETVLAEAKGAKS